ncbi:MAG: hypothetical protein HN742_39880 [Lentisphaerae bacterium]|jgi:hypothetical protein|nr:hypothetical protein [Lentisphaerota bacterium]MBT4817955.1 hypothetical protein [Lentisphaerota bacterium]MBT5611338.1 hypothetical protein [Lentisphaerota bacterium]MBT7058136.1 hypothetical protein [Lentisphaerota bacterium]MBT7848096.1 hypothetical protein [Lentisphaerota bacterium]
MRCPVVLVLTALLICTGCARTGYWIDRQRDAADVVSASVGVGLGARAQVGPVVFAPFVAAMDVAGVRGGELFQLEEMGFRDKVVPTDFGALWWCSTVFFVEREPRLLHRGKAVFALPPLVRDDRQFNIFSETIPFVSVPRRDLVSEGLSLPRYPLSYWGNIELVAGLGGTLRLGLNPMEFVDFMGGWFRFDLLRDDCGVD